MTWWCDISNTGRHPFGCLIKSFFVKSSIFNEIIAYQKLFCVVTLLASSSNHDKDDENETITKATGLISKTEALNMRQTFWQISLPLSHDLRYQT